MNKAPLSGRYELEEIIGTGGMSVVYRAWDLKYDREVAVKVLRTELNEDEDFIRRFNGEAQAASKMSHPNIVAMYDVGQDEGTRYIVMEYVRGVTLKDVIRQQGRIKPQRAVQIAQKILAAIDHAHKNGIVHRDIKPQNILMDRDGNVKVADFGIARAVNSASGTKAGGNVMGSVHYFSPEQANGLVADEKSDLYSMGVVVYEMLTGQVPFDGETGVAIALKHINEEPKAPSKINPDISVGMEEVVLKALEKEPSGRYQSAGEFATDLRRALKMPMGGFIRKSADEVRRRARKKTDGKLYLKLTIVALIAAIMGAGAVSGWRLFEHMQTRVRVPDIVLDDMEDAVAQLEALGLIGQVTESYHDEIIAGIVYEQSPAEGMLLYPGETVMLNVSKGKEAIPVPQVTGMGLVRSEAEAILTDAGLMPGGIVLEISEEKVGTVIRQEPAAGEMAEPFSEVVLYVSGESALVPTLDTLTVELARSTLAASGFQLGEVQEKLSEAEPGTVIAQSVEAGQLALIGDSVDIVISQIIPENYYAETSVTVTVEDDGDEILCMLTDGMGETREVYREKSEAGNQTINLNLDSLIQGEQVLSVYIKDELVVEKTIVFDVKQTQ